MDAFVKFIPNTMHNVIPATSPTVGYLNKRQQRHVVTSQSHKDCGVTKCQHENDVPKQKLFRVVKEGEREVSEERDINVVAERRRKQQQGEQHPDGAVTVQYREQRELDNPSQKKVWEKTVAVNVEAIPPLHRGRRCTGSSFDFGFCQRRRTPQVGRGDPLPERRS